MVSPDDADARKELLLLSPSILVPCLTHDGAKVWDTLAIAEYLNEIKPQAGLLPADRIARAHCRAICGEMHSGFANLRSALPMNLKAQLPGTRSGPARSPTSSASPRSGPSAWPPTAGRTCSASSADGRRDVRAGGHALPHLRREAAKPCAAYCKTIMAMPEMKEWIAAAKLEPDEIDELDMEF